MTCGRMTLMIWWNSKVDIVALHHSVDCFQPNGYHASLQLFWPFPPFVFLRSKKYLETKNRKMCEDHEIMRLLAK